MTIFLVITTVAAILIALRQTVIAQKQTEIAQKATEKLDEQQREVTDWLVKHETLALQLSKIGAHMAIRRPDGSDMYIYPTIFPDAKFREKLERYVVHRNGSVLTPLSHTELELRSPALRETVAKAIQILDEFAKLNPGIVELYMAPE